MRVGIPLFGDQVAPRFEATQDFLLVDLHGDQASSRRVALYVEPEEKNVPGACLSLGIDVLICCGIQRWSEQTLAEKKVRVIAGVMGSAEQALECFREGTLQAGQILPATHRTKTKRIAAEPQ